VGAALAVTGGVGGAATGGGGSPAQAASGNVASRASRTDGEWKRFDERMIFLRAQHRPIAHPLATGHVRQKYVHM